MEQKIAIEDRLSGLSSLIGNTPLLEINLKYKGDKRRIYARLAKFGTNQSYPQYGC